MLVYRLNFTCGESFIGKSVRKFKTRMEEYKTEIGTAEYKFSCYSTTNSKDKSISILVVAPCFGFGRIFEGDDI